MLQCVAQLIQERDWALERANRLEGLLVATEERETHLIAEKVEADARAAVQIEEVQKQVEMEVESLLGLQREFEVMTKACDATIRSLQPQSSHQQQPQPPQQGYGRDGGRDAGVGMVSYNSSSDRHGYGRFTPPPATSNTTLQQHIQKEHDLDLADGRSDRDQAHITTSSQRQYDDLDELRAQRPQDEEGSEGEREEQELRRTRNAVLEKKLKEMVIVLQQDEDQMEAEEDSGMTQVQRGQEQEEQQQEGQEDKGMEEKHESYECEGDERLSVKAESDPRTEAESNESTQEQEQEKEENMEEENKEEEQLHEQKEQEEKLLATLHQKYALKEAGGGSSTSSRQNKRSDESSPTPKEPLRAVKPSPQEELQAKLARRRRLNEEGSGEEAGPRKPLVLSPLGKKPLGRKPLVLSPPLASQGSAGNAGSAGSAGSDQEEGLPDEMGAVMEDSFGFGGAQDDDSDSEGEDGEEAGKAGKAETVGEDDRGDKQTQQTGSDDTAGGGSGAAEGGEAASPPVRRAAAKGEKTPELPGSRSVGRLKIQWPPPSPK
jgi:hypothetical protein